jgi:hypothetical protein
MPLRFGAGVDVPGTVVPCPPSRTYWYEGPSEVSPDRLIVSGLTYGIVTEPLEGGSGSASIVIAEDGTPGLQVEMVRTGVWDVLMTDYFGDLAGGAPCPDVDPTAALGDVVRVFMGMAGGEGIARLNDGHQELDVTVAAFLRPNATAPEGIGGRCLFQNIYVAVEGNTPALVKITPVIDGELLTDEQIIFAVPADGVNRSLHRFEVPLSRAYDLAAVEQSRAGIIGTWFTFEMEVLDAFGCGRLEIHGVELEYVPMTESVVGQVFTGESLSVPLSPSPTNWFMAGEGGVWKGSEGIDDAGADIPVLAQTVEVAPAGVGGECLFQNIYLGVTRFNAQDWDIVVTGVLDGVDLESTTITLEGVVAPVTEVLEISLAQPYEVGAVEQSRYHPRGAWLAIRIDAAEGPDAEVIFEGPSLEYEVLTESLEAVE